MPSNPASSVRGPRYSYKKGKTPILDEDGVKKLFAGIDTSTVAAPMFVMGADRRRSARPRANCDPAFTQEKPWLTIAASVGQLYIGHESRR